MKLPSLTLLLAMTVLPTFAQANRGLTLEQLEDKIRGGWAGQMIGVSYGAPTEFHAQGRILEENPWDFHIWNPKRIENTLGQDDLYVEMTFMRVIEQHGLEATSAQYGAAFKDSQYSLWHANAAARRLLNRGVQPPMSGHPKYNAHSDDIDFQIESDFIGLMTPGLPQAANALAQRVGCVMNYGDGIYGGMFVAGMYAAAFFESDPRKLVEAGLASIPSQSSYARLIRDILDWSAEHPDDWRATWRLIQDKWDRNDPCPDGALQAFNIDAKLNGGYIALGLLYGDGDFARTMEISTRAGQDSDCNPSSAAGVLGVALGFYGIADEWKSGLDAIADKKFEYTDYSFNQVTALTVKCALTSIKNAGGKVEGGRITIPHQAPKAPALEQWTPGIPDKILAATGADWKWTGTWVDQKGDDGKVRGKRAAGQGAEATFEFEGVGVFLVGNMSQSGGRADVFLDGKPAGQIDAYVPPRTFDNDLWHVEGLKPGRHTVRIVTRDDHDAASTGTEIELHRAIVFGPTK